MYSINNVTIYNFPFVSVIKSNRKLTTTKRGIKAGANAIPCSNFNFKLSVFFFNIATTKKKTKTRVTEVDTCDHIQIQLLFFF